MAGGGTHGIVHHDQGQRAQRATLFFKGVHFRNLFVQRATHQVNPERVGFESFFRLTLFDRETFGTEIAIVLMAINAVVDFGLHLALTHAQVSEFEAITSTTKIGQNSDTVATFFGDRFGWYQSAVVNRRGQIKTDPPFNSVFAIRHGHGQDAPANQKLDFVAKRVFVF